MCFDSFVTIRGTWCQIGVTGFRAMLNCFAALISVTSHGSDAYDQPNWTDYGITAILSRKGSKNVVTAKYKSASSAKVPPHTSDAVKYVYHYITVRKQSRHFIA